MGRQVDKGLGRVDVRIEGPGGDGGGGHEEVGGRASQHPADAALHGRFFILRREEALVHVLVAHHVEEHREEEAQKLGEGNGTESEMSRRNVRRHPAPAPGHGDRHGHADEEAGHHHAAAQEVGIRHRVQASEEGGHHDDAEGDEGSDIFRDAEDGVQDESHALVLVCDDPDVGEHDDDCGENAGKAAVDLLDNFRYRLGVHPPDLLRDEGEDELAHRGSHGKGDGGHEAVLVSACGGSAEDRSRSHPGSHEGSDEDGSRKGPPRHGIVLLGFDLFPVINSDDCDDQQIGYDAVKSERYLHVLHLPACCPKQFP